MSISRVFFPSFIFPQLSNFRGLTLVELVISMLILSAIGATGGVAFVQVLRVNRQIEERSQAFEKMRSTGDMVRKIAANLVPAPMVGLEPYAEVIDPKTGNKAYQCVVRPPEHLMGGDASRIWGEVMRLWLVSEKSTQSLHLSRQYVGSEGLLGQTEECVLAENLRGFSLRPMYQEEKQGKKEQGEKVEMLVSFNMWVDFNLSDGEEVSTSLIVPVRNRPQKE